MILDEVSKKYANLIRQLDSTETQIYALEEKIESQRSRGVVAVRQSDLNRLRALEKLRESLMKKIASIEVEGKQTHFAGGITQWT
jgi:Mg2+ and Co2+ transporter CorA